MTTCAHRDDESESVAKDGVIDSKSESQLGQRVARLGRITLRRFYFCE